VRRPLGDLEGLDFTTGIGTMNFSIHVTDTAGATVTDDTTMAYLLLILVAGLAGEQRMSSE
jgi:hypothetical protein